MKGTKKLFIIFLILSVLIASTVMVFALESSDVYLEVEFIPLGIHGDSFVARIGDQQLLVDAGGKTHHAPRQQRSDYACQRHGALKGYRRY